MVEQYVVIYVRVRAFGRLREHKVRRGCRSGEITAFCVDTGSWRADHGLSPEDLEKVAGAIESLWKPAWPQ
jgi:hypothetical protein